MDIKTYEISDFTKINIGMSYNEVLRLMDEKAIIYPNVGNFRWEIYNLTDGSQMKLGFWPSGALAKMEIIDPAGRVFQLSQD